MHAGNACIHPGTGPVRFELRFTAMIDGIVEVLVTPKVGTTSGVPGLSHASQQPIDAHVA